MWIIVLTLLIPIISSIVYIAHSRSRSRKGALTIQAARPTYKQLVGIPDPEVTKKFFTKDREKELIQMVNRINVKAIVYIQIAKFYFYAQHFQAAIPYLNKALFKITNSNEKVQEKELLRMLAICFYRTGKLDQAQKSFEYLKKMGTGNLKNFSLPYALFLESTHEAKDSIPYFLQACHESPNEVLPITKLGHMYYAQDKFQKALSTLSSLSSISTENGGGLTGENRNMAGISAIMTENYDKANELFQSYIASESWIEQFLYTWAQTCSNLYFERNDLALKDLEALRVFVNQAEDHEKDLEPYFTSLLTIYGHVAPLYERLKLWAYALEVYRKINKKKPEYLDSVEKIGTLTSLINDTIMSAYFDMAHDSFNNLARAIVTVLLKEEHVESVDLVQRKSIYADYIAVSANDYGRAERCLFRFYKMDEQDVQQPTSLIHDTAVRELYSQMLDQRSSRAYAITTGTFSETCYSFTQSRSITLINRNRLEEVFSDIAIERQISGVKGNLSQSPEPSLASESSSAPEEPDSPSASDVPPTDEPEPLS